MEFSVQDLEVLLWIRAVVDEESLFWADPEDLGF
jgi:hypothetical protein